MTAAAPAAAVTLRLRWLPPTFLLLLVVPFHPYWLDFEMVRRGLLLLLCGAALAASAITRRVALPPALSLPGARWLAAFVLWMAITALLHWGSASAWDACYRLVWYAALLVLLRIGAAFPAESWLRPVCWLLIATSVFGLLQRLGLGEWSGYGTPGEPVSVFGNLNVAAEFAAVAVAATAALGLRTRPLPCAALFFAGAYLVVNGSRSGMLVAPIGLLIVLFHGLFHGKAAPRSAAPLATALLCGAALGLGIRTWGVDTGRPKPPAAAAEAAAGERTKKVRLEIWQSCLNMAADAPLLGTGPGQFQVQYPRFRSQREIELSSNGREFATEAGTAHDDWLEILVEGGIPGLLLWLLFFARMLWAARQSPHALAPLAALAALMFVRAPLGNAPATAIAMLLAGTLRPPASGRARTRPWLTADAAGAALLLVLGALPVLGNCAFIPYQRAKSRFEKGAPGLEMAATFAPFVPQVWQALAQERQFLAKDAAGAESALAAAEHAVALRPNEPSFLLLRADLLRMLGRLPAARLDLEQAAALDPGDPQWRVQRSALEFTAGNHEAAIAVVWDRPPPALLKRLPQHFADLEKLLRAKNDPMAERYGAERTFAAALLSLPHQQPPDQQQMARTSQLVAEMLPAFFRAGLKSSDARPWWLAALHALDIDDRDSVEQTAQGMRRLGLEVPQWQRDLMGETGLAKLRSVGSWAELLK